MNKFESLLSIIVTDLNREYLFEQKESLCKNVCSEELHGSVNPNELDIRNTRIINEDNNRVFVSMKMKKGFDVTVPVSKSKPYTRNLSRKLYS